MEYDAKIYVAGHEGLVGSALMRVLKKAGYHNIITRSFSELDLRNQQTTFDFFSQQRPEYVFIAAARVGGIKANRDNPAVFIYDNLMIASNIIHAAHLFSVKKLLFLGSSCIYPRICPQPILEEYLLSGTLEETNRPYAIAKIAGIELCTAYQKQYGHNFIACMPTNLYGPGDTFDPDQSHVIPALIHKMQRAHQEGHKAVTLWGTGTARREFLFVDDCAQALLFLMTNYSSQHLINVGTGSDITIYDLAHTIKHMIGYDGQLIFDATFPDGTPRKMLSVDRINTLGWRAHVSLEDGLRQTIDWYQAHIKSPELRL